jgi:nucleoid DNA-binding protein
MHKSELVRAIALQTSLNQEQAKEALEAFVSTIALASYDNEDVVIAGFGKFVVKVLPEREGRNPATGAKIVVPSSKTVVFKPSSTFREKL